MVPALDSIGSVIEFSIGLAGFSGIISALSANNWGPLEQYRTLVLLFSSLVPGFAGFMALIWHSYLGPEVAWQLSAWSFIAMLTPLIFVATYGRKIFQVRRFPQFNPHRVNFAISILAIALALQILILIEVAPDVHGTMFLAGLVSVLFVGAIQFFAALVHARRDTNDT